MANSSTSVIVSSYNQPNSLDLVLAAFASQADPDFEMVVADDGSERDTVELVEAFKKTAPFDLKIARQEHTTFRKASALNLAVRESSGEQLIFCDGDCVPFRDFTAVHRAHFQPDGYAAGGYIFLTEAESRSLSPESVKAGAHERFLSNAKRGLMWTHLKNRVYRLFRVKDKPKILGGNFSVARSALLEVNGFDEGFEGASGEDSDLRNRLNRIGCRGVSLWNAAFVCHLDHSLDPRRCAENVLRAKRDRELIAANFRTPRTPRGIEKG